MNQQAKKYYNQGLEFFKDNKPLRAISRYKQAIGLDKNFIEALTNLAVTYQSLGKKNLAIRTYQKVLKLDPNLSIVYYNLASLHQVSDPDLAIKFYEKAIMLEPKDWDSLNRLGVLYKNLGKLDKAVDCYQKAIAINPDFENALFNLGVVKSIIGITARNPVLIKESLQYFEAALELDPESAEILSNIGLIYQNLDQDDTAKKFYNRAISLSKNMPQIYYNLGSLHEKMGDIVKTAKYYKQALVIDPTFPETLGSYCFIVKQLADWDEYQKQLPIINQETKLALTKNQKTSETPFFNAVRKDDPKENAAVAKVWSDYWIDKYRHLNPPVFSHRPNPKKKIRIAYTSEGFREFPTTHNLTGVLENHDHKQFELYIYSYGSDDKSKYRKRIVAAADVFRDVKNQSLIETAQQIYDDKIDILIDLKGHTRGSRFQFMYSKPAPIQIEWLGFVGTTQADFIDYFIADKIVLPPKNRGYFSEKIIYMPNCYWPTNDRLEIDDKKYRRRDFGLPENALVLASFNQPYKIEPELFAVWMRILKHIPQAVLWQWSPQKARKMILSQAKKYGVNKKQIVFADDMPKEIHLARLQLADLGLDTTVCNGHTTTTDALWAGIPVITTLGKHFASRVSASMLSNINLPELIAKDLKEYEALVINYLTKPQKLEQLKQKLQANLKTQPLFKTQEFTQDLERAYQLIWKDYLENLSPKDIYV